MSDTSARSYVLPPAADEVDFTPPSETDYRNSITAELLRDTIWQTAVTSPRSLQPSIGASEIGGECNRQIAYRATRVPAVNFSDPMRALAGIGLHHALAEQFMRADGGSGRFLVEHRVVYRDIPGTVDLYDRRRKMVIDWKSALLKKLRDVRTNGPSRKYIVQAQVYAAALAEAGEEPEDIAVVYVPLDGTLADLRAYVTSFDRSVADDAIDRFILLREQAISAGPAKTGANPTRLCPWCAHYRPGSSDLAVGCPGNTASAASTTS